MLAPLDDRLGPPSERVHFLADPAVVLTEYTTSRRTFLDAVATLSPGELDTPSRCHAWSVADVLRHLITVDDRYVANLRGEPIASLRGFDPNQTPTEWIEPLRQVPDREICGRFAASSETLIALLDPLDRDRFGQPSRSPIGAVPWWLSLMHGFYDNWVHQRDVLLAVDREPGQQDGAARLVLGYSAALCALLNRGELGPLTLAGVGIGPGIPVGVDPYRPQPDGPVIDGDHGLLVDVLNGRCPPDEPLKSLTPHLQEQLTALARFFAPA